MEVTRWKKIEELFITIRELTSTKQQEYLDKLCLEDMELCEEVTDLLELDNCPHSFLDQPFKRCELTKIFEQEPLGLGAINFSI